MAVLLCRREELAHKLQDPCMAEAERLCFDATAVEHPLRELYDAVSNVLNNQVLPACAQKESFLLALTIGAYMRVWPVAYCI